ncbi:tetraspanin-10 [Perognathus longimembris pacificus]|uniref:tetraspanin-10 n=1 Tax=Perognathus longimembris pacificus TaxID=214514 RepID=UPI00201A185A|nr:tetraspanin-10 [Perognathus longimembris pacificus]
MEEGERSPLLSQDAAGLKPSLCNSGPASSGPGPSLSMGSSCAKYLIVLSNFLSSLVGLLALLGGLWGLAVKGSSGSAQGGPLPEAPALGLVLAGLAVSAVSLAGCLGALCESRCLLSCFSGAVLACLVLEALAGALVLALWGPLRDGLAHTLHVAVIRYQDDPDLRFLLDQVQLGLQCCGAASYQDWRQNLCFNCSSPAAQACGVPTSCCIHPREAGAAVSARCGLGALRLDQRVAARAVHLRGCGPALRRWLRAHARTAGACAAAVLVVQGAELLWASWLLRALASQAGAGAGGTLPGGHGTRPTCGAGPVSLQGQKGILAGSW